MLFNNQNWLMKKRSIQTNKNKEIIKNIINQKKTMTDSESDSESDSDSNEYNQNNHNHNYQHNNH